MPVDYVFSDYGDSVRKWFTNKKTELKDVHLGKYNF